MAQDRSLLQAKLVAVTANVYFQPPQNVQMRFPCIVYERDNAHADYADNSQYRYFKRYQVTVIDRDPDSLIPDAVSKFPLTSFQRHFVADGLHHDVFFIYF